MPQGRSGQLRSVEASRFAMPPRSDVPRSAFDVAFYHKTTFDAAWLVPIYVEEILPGDSLRCRLTAFCRLSTPIVPVMDNLVMETFFFFVPYRLVWANWERFMGERASITDTTTFLVPQCTVPVLQTGYENLQDYMGITLNETAASSINVSALPFRAYYLIVNDWFRDEDLVNPLTVDTGDGPDVTGYVLQVRMKRFDYFTSARPWPEKQINFDVTGNIGPRYQGGPFTAMYQGIKSAIPVTGIGVTAGTSAVAGGAQIETGNRGLTWPNQFDGADVWIRSTAFDVPDVRVVVNDIRTGFMVQNMMEKNARGGSRYAEIVWEHFKVRSPDARLQRPEYLGGGKTFVTVNPIAQTSASGIAGTSTVLGEQAGIGYAVAQNHGFSHSFTEHGVILGLVNVRADLTYQNGIERMWFRRTQFDFYWPSLAHLGEQAIISAEIYADGSALDAEVFGYQERWSEYKYKPNRVSGLFRSKDPTPLDMWHFADNFATRPALNAGFVQQSSVAIDRVLQVDSNNGAQFLFDGLFDLRWARPMPMYSIPGLGSRF